MCDLILLLQIPAASVCKKLFKIMPAIAYTTHWEATREFMDIGRRNNIPEALGRLVEQRNALSGRGILKGRYDHQRQRTVLHHPGQTKEHGKRSLRTTPNICDEQIDNMCKRV